MEDRRYQNYADGVMLACEQVKTLLEHSLPLICFEKLSSINFDTVGNEY